MSDTNILCDSMHSRRSSYRVSDGNRQSAGFRQWLSGLYCLGKFLFTCTGINCGTSTTAANVYRVFSGL